MKIMKLKFIAILVATFAVFGWRTEAQTNIAPIISTNQNTATPEIREVNGQPYDVSKPPFISVTIPAGSALVNTRYIHYNPDAPKPCELVLQIPAIYNFNRTHPVKVGIRNFPYSPSYFQNGDWQTGYKEKTGYKDVRGGTPTRYEIAITTGLVTKESITLRLFPLFPARTNFDAVGAKIVIPASPIFDYGTPVASTQTNLAPVTGTNFVAAASDFREVNREPYTIQSKKWEAAGGDILAVLNNAIVVQKVTKVPAAYGKNEYGQRIVTAYTKIPDLKYVLLNYPTKNAAVGESIWVRAMRAGTTNYNGETLELWDCGKPQ